MATVSIYKTNTLAAVADTDTVVVEGGDVDIDTGLDLSALTEGLTAMIVSRAYSGNIGSPSTSLKVDFDVAAGSHLTYNAGSGSMFYTPGGDNTLANLVRCIGFGTLTINGSGIITRLEVGRGNVVIGSGITVTNLHIAGGTVSHFGTGGTSPTVIEITGGSYTTQKGAVTSLSIHGGTVSIDTTNTIATLLQTGGSLQLLRSGTITQANLYGGTIDSSNLSKSIVITNTTIWASVTGASAFTDNNLITFTNPAVFRIATGNNY